MTREWIDPNQIIDKIRDYDWARKHLCIRLRNAEQVEEELRVCPWEQIEDLALSYHLMFGEPRGGTFVVTVTQELLSDYGITEEELKEEAIRHSAVCQMARLEPLYQTMERLSQEEKEVGLQSGDTRYKIWVLTNEERRFGASCILYPGMIELARECVGEDFYILPSSVHELLLLPRSYEGGTETLRSLVREVNRATVPPNERLSDEVYVMDENGCLKIVHEIAYV